MVVTRSLAIGVFEDLFPWLTCCFITVLLLFYFRGAESLLNQGIEWEKKGEYNRAIEMYMKITPSMTTDHELVEDAMVKVSVISQVMYC